MKLIQNNKDSLILTIMSEGPVAARCSRCGKTKFRRHTTMYMMFTCVECNRIHDVRYFNGIFGELDYETSID